MSFYQNTGRTAPLWRAVDQDGDEIGILVQHKRNKQAALRFFRELFRKTTMRPHKIVTDKLPSYRAALKELDTSAAYVTDRYQNKRAELSYQTPHCVNEKCRGSNHKDKPSSSSPSMDWGTTFSVSSIIC
ncbi:DDE-type integrase/transposase/recombinase [Desulfuromusa kysingii]|uniref:DDE-type integrase/transposase/recombinase n=1 Tax=Desulfuromusa kysingii TaxID=37625 RepID=UPI000B81BEAD|nr:DDE-type integrase/transposase/recombinase [Desulfuromusa kysingii]